MSAATSTASAPGKILWVGGYSVLEKGCTSLVSAVDKYVTARCTLEPALKDSAGVKLVSRDFGYSIEGSFDAKEGALAFRDAPGQAKFVSRAVEVCMNYLHAKGVRPSGLEVETSSEGAFGVGGGKSGLGSSAAVTVATVGAVLGAFGQKRDIAVCHKLSQIVHSLAQGKVGSGFDVAAACLGSCQYSRYSPEIVSALGDGRDGGKIVASVVSEWDFSAHPVRLPQDFVLVFAKIAGQSASTTEMVKKVAAWKRGEPQNYSDLVSRLDSENRKAISALQTGQLENFRERFEHGRALTRELGVRSGAPIEPPALSRLIEQSYQKGAFACKLPGAGGGDGIAAICLGEKNAVSLRAFWGSYKEVKLELLPVGFGRRGLEVSGR